MPLLPVPEHGSTDAVLVKDNDTDECAFVLDEHMPSSDLICWATLDAITRQPGCCLAGARGPDRLTGTAAGGGGGDVEVLDGDEALVEGGGAGGSGNGSLREEQDECLSTLALAREVR
jgi:hypothetical protein